MIGIRFPRDQMDRFTAISSTESSAYNRFGEVMTVEMVWRYLNGDRPTKGSIFPRETVRNLMRQDKIKSCLKGGRLFTFRKAVDAYLEQIKRIGDESLDILPLNLDERMCTIYSKRRTL